MARKTKKYVYFFGNGKGEGDASMKEILGGKGANLAEMTNLNVPVPPGFTISTETCAYYYKHGNKYPKEMSTQILANMAKLEKAMGAKFGGKEKPLLVSVRSGAALSMPGMMDTVLNLGLNPDSIQAMIRATGNPTVAWDAYRRLIQMFGEVVMGMPFHTFESILDIAKKKAKVKADTDLNVAQLQNVVEQFLQAYRKHTKEAFPVDPHVQLQKAIDAVFGSWNNPRAIRYREMNEIRGLLGTAVNVQAMVFGNMGQTSGTGVCFSRDPSTGKNKFYGEYLINAQGEDVVAGIRTPQPISKLSRRMPKIYKQLVTVKNGLERHYKDMQDIEFTIQEGVLYFLQTRTGKRTAQAAVKTAVDMVKEKLITQKEAIMRIPPSSLDQLLHPTFDPKAKRTVIAKGLPASPGAAAGKIVLTAAKAEEEAAKGETVILVRVETSPEDIGGMHAAVGILTERGGMTSHAAVVARGMGKCCVAGSSDIKVNEKKKTVTAGSKTLKEGDFISLDGSKGEVYPGNVATVPARLSREFNVLMGWADKVRKLNVRTNADTPHDSQQARAFGAEGIGLCRTEHMFFEGDRINAVRQMILASQPRKNVLEALSALEGTSDAADKKTQKALLGEFKVLDKRFAGALKKLLPMQRKDFEGIFKAMNGLPVTIRLLDPPLHEFLPHDAAGQAQVAKTMKVPPRQIKDLVDSLHEFNPMLGHRGCRLAITYPEIYQMQAAAIIEAALNAKKKGIKVLPEIMVPLVGTLAEFEKCRDDIVRVANDVFKKRGKKIKYTIGTMIEVPRAALVADKIATKAEFFSFGTNDLTQMTCGFSRDDAGKFLGDYVKQEIFLSDPFQSLDQAGVGKLVEIGVKLGRKKNKKLKIGICGEHGGDPASVVFCHNVGMNYVSCSPFRVPIARLAAAQAVIA